MSECELGTSSVRRPRPTRSCRETKKMMYGEINVVYCESHRERVNTLCRQKAGYVNVTVCGITISLTVIAVTLQVAEAQQPLRIRSYLLDKIKICPKLCSCVEVRLCYGRISTKTDTTIPTQLSFYSRFLLP